MAKTKIEEVKKTIGIPEEQIEQLLLNKFYTSNDYRNLVLNHYESRYLYNENISKILDILVEYYHEYNDVPEKNVVSMILQQYGESDKTVDSKKLEMTFKNALEIDVSKDEEFVKTNVLGYIQNRASYFAIMDDLEYIDKFGDVSNCIEKLQKIIGISFDTNLGLDYFAQLDEHFDEISNPEAMIATLYKAIDNVTYGGFPRLGKALCVFMAQSGIGKSLMLSNLAVNFIQQNLNPVIITLEMPEVVYAKRIDAHISEMNINSLQFNVDKAKEKIRDFHKLCADGRLLIKDYPPSSINCNNIKSYMDRVISSGFKPDVLLVDYINLLNTNSNNKNAGMYERVGDVSRELRALSYYFGIPVISATQSNREGWDTSDVSMSNVSESAGIVHTVDFLAALWQQEGDREANRLNSTILKNRFGGMVGKTNEFHIDYNSLRLKDMIRTEPEILTATQTLAQDLEHLGDIGDL